MPGLSPLSARSRAILWIFVLVGIMPLRLRVWEPFQTQLTQQPSFLRPFKNPGKDIWRYSSSKEGKGQEIIPPSLRQQPSTGPLSETNVLC